MKSLSPHLGLIIFRAALTDTVIKWHREGFRLYWRWKSKAPIGRPPLDKEIRELIRRISRENPLWGAPRIQSELRLLGFDVTEKTVAKYRVKHAKPPSQTWKTFLANHANQIAAVDFSQSRRSISAFCTASSSSFTVAGRSFISM